MKKPVEKLLSLALAGAMAFSPAVTTFAAETDTAAETTEVETAVFGGETYYLLYTIVCEDSLTTTDPQFDAYFEGTAEEGVAAIVAAGDVYINGQQIPYVLEDGSYSAQELLVNGEQAIWQVEGGWAWSAHKQRNWDEDYYMPDLEEGYVVGQAVDLYTAGYLYTKHMAHVVGQTIELYAAEGSDVASVISSTFYNSTLVSAMEKVDGVVHFTNDEGEELGIDFPVANVDESIEVEDMIIYWQDGVLGWIAKRAYAQVGVLVENTDPDNADAAKEPYFLEEGTDELITTGDSYIGKNFGEAFRHTQYIRGHRRTGQYYTGDTVIMWSSDEGADHVIGFTRGDNAYAALAQAVKYAGAVTADIMVSADGTDVPSDTYWVTPEIWMAYQEVMIQAQEMVAAASSTNIEYDNMILELANVLGGGEDLNSTGPLKMNPLGVIGSIQFGTAE